MKWMKKKPEYTVGIDAGTVHLKILCLQRHLDHKYELAAYGAMHSNSPAIHQMAEELSHYSVRVNIDHPSLKIKEVQLPVLPAAEIPSAVQFAFKRESNIHLNDYVVRFRPLPSEATSEGKQKYFVYGIERAAVDQRVKEMQKLGFKHIDIVEPNESALANVYKFATQTQPETHQPTPVAIMDVGASRTLFVVMDQGEVASSRVITAVSGHALTEQVSRDLGISLEEAEAKKLRFDPKQSTSENERLSNTISIFISSAVLEIQRSLDAYSIASQREITHVFLTGGGSQITTFFDRLAGALGLPVKTIDPFERIELNYESDHAFHTKKFMFDIACGLALDG
jgi:type IV pilus assembly protein PilM